MDSIKIEVQLRRKFRGEGPGGGREQSLFYIVKFCLIHPDASVFLGMLKVSVKEGDSCAPAPQESLSDWQFGQKST